MNMRLLRPGLIFATLLLCAPALAGTAASIRVASLIDASEHVRRAGRPADALHMLRLAEPLLVQEASPVERGRLRLQRARCDYYSASLGGTSQEANIAELRAVVSDAEALNDARLLADARDMLGLAIYSRDFRDNAMEEPRQLFEQALAARRKLADDRGVAESLFHVGLTFENKKDPAPGDLRRAVANHEEALSIASGKGYDIEASYAVRHLAGHKQDAGDLDAALAGFERSLMLRLRAGYQIYLAPALMAIGDVWKDKGDVVRARDYYLRAQAEADRLGARRFQDSARESLSALAGGTPPG
jgi:hypothetical protein